MKKNKIAVIAVLALIMTMFLASCGSSKALAGDPAVGEWTLVSAEYAGVTITAEELSSVMEAMPVFTINEDGSCVFSFGGEDGQGTVAKAEDGSYTLSDSSDQALSFTIDGEQLKLDYTAMDMLLVFEK